MDVHFPVFVHELDISDVDLVRTPAGLGYYEQIDIENGEFEGWDREGYRITLIWTGQDPPTAEIASDEPVPQELREAILAYGREYGWQPKPGDEKLPSDPVELLKLIEDDSQRKRVPLLEHLRRWLARF